MGKIIFDLSKTQPRGNCKYHGGGKYGIAVFMHFANIHPKNTIAYYDNRSYIDKGVLKIISEKGIEKFLKSEISIDALSQQKQCIIYSPLYNGDYRGAKKAIVTIHGLRTLEMPFDSFEKYFPDKRNIIQNIMMRIGLNHLREIFLKKYFHQKHISKAQSIYKYKNIDFITVSEHSKSSLLNFVPSLRNEDIRVFYSPSTINDSIKSESYMNPFGRYYMLVSGDRWLKNPLRAIIAFDILFEERKDLDFNVVVTGIKDISVLKLHIKNPKRFICVGYVDEEDLKSLYKHAYALVYPSLNEGFGYPPLEAMHEGCPVLASAIASIPEICGDAALYFNPFLIDEIKMRILMMETSEIHTRYVNKGIARESLIRNKQVQDLEDFCDYLFQQL